MSVGLRETARRVGVSATAAYRHFDSKEEVAAEGFRELSAAMRAAVDSREPLISLGPAYVEFALQKRGLFRLMFGPLLIERGKYPGLNEAVNEVLGLIQEVVTGEAGKPHDENPATLTVWGLVHGLSILVIDGLVPESQARLMAEQILASRAATLSLTRPAVRS
jgi:AcrR family transcriptional regulator